MERNLRLYPFYSVFFHSFAWTPIFFLYLNSLVPLQQVLWLNAAYYIAVVVLEVPSGFFSDRCGRRLTLLVSASCLLSAYLLFFSATHFWQLLFAELLTAAGFAFNSGSDTSLYFDSLQALDQQSEYGEREARLGRLTFLSSSLSVLLGGIVGTFNLRYAYLLSSAFAGASILIVLFLKEPMKTTSKESFSNQLKSCVSYLKAPALRWVFLAMVFFTIVVHVPYEFYQPYLKLLGRNYSWAKNQTPFLCGLVLCLVNAAAALASGWSYRLSGFLGFHRMVLFSLLAQVITIVFMGQWLHPLLLIAIILRNVPKGLTRAPIRAFISPKVAAHHRATYFSIQSLAGRLCFSATLFALSLMAGKGAITNWSTLASLLKSAAAFGVVGLVALAALAKRIDWDEPSIS